MDIPKQWHWCGIKCHLVDIIKDGDTEIVIYKKWNRSRQQWAYTAEERWLTEIQIQKWSS